jgi:hypothetical protein
LGKWPSCRSFESLCQQAKQVAQLRLTLAVFVLLGSPYLLWSLDEPYKEIIDPKPLAFRDLLDSSDMF